jgi:flagellin
MAPRPWRASSTRLTRPPRSRVWWREASFANGSYVIRLRSSEYGANFRVNLDDSRGLVISGGGATNVVGRNAEYTVSINTAAGVTSVKFVGGRSAGESGLRLTDTYGNVILLTEAGNATANLVQVARITAGQLQFQVGANAGQTVALSLNNMSITQLGTGVVAGKSLADIDVTKTGGADEALRIIDAAIAQVSKLRGDMGRLPEEHPRKQYALAQCREGEPDRYRVLHPAM